MTSMPWRTHSLMAQVERACAATRLPQALASCTHTVISSGVNWLISLGMPVMDSPDRLIFSVSTPYLANMRTQRRISSAPLTIAPKANSGCGRCGAVVSPRPPGTVISWLAAR
jgi:hypothetical protein